MDWYRLKQFISHATSLSMDALHIIVGLIAFLLVARLFNRPLSDGRPWLTVLGLELINEWGDLFVERWPEAASQYGEAAKDVALTMLVPTVLLILERHRARRSVPVDPAEQVDAPE